MRFDEVGEMSKVDLAGAFIAITISIWAVVEVVPFLMNWLVHSEYTG